VHTDEQAEVRDPGLLKLFFANFGDRSDVLRLARDQHVAHRRRADDYRVRRDELTDFADRWHLKTIELGIRYERCVEEFWADVLRELEDEQP
ncbi:MAG TPA: hypothetical protein VHH15_11175, partial [Actinophytocola sp.]|nr:hypothetical protein [Actinophytocola sp.]